MIYQFKEFKKHSGAVRLEKVCWKFQEGLDTRVVNAALRWRKNDNTGIQVVVEAGVEKSEAYRLQVSEDQIRIAADGDAGAFYAIQSLKVMAKAGEVPCCEIYDYPDMACRGFYHDVTRGKVPTLETLKNLVDICAQMKINMLQLYVEHTFEFKEYEFCRERLGYLTREEMMELDQYCNANFIEFVPSLATFGHLYHLLEHDTFKHLCEIQNHKPSFHYWLERQLHHTINPSLAESFEVIKSLLDQYMSVFSSDKFNICGDETFDLGRGANAGKDKGELYYIFIRKIMDYLRSKGKQVMMWGDVIIKHPEFIEKFPDNTIFLPWSYGAEPNEEQFQKFHEVGKRMIACPGTSSWLSFTCRPNPMEENIAKMAEYVYQYGAEGLMNTNWGDWGNPCSIELALYGMFCGATISWNKSVVFDSTFRKEASLILYNDERVADWFAELTDMRECASWEHLVRYVGGVEVGNPYKVPICDLETYEAHMKRCLEIRDMALESNINTMDSKEELVAAFEIQALMTKWMASLNGINIECTVSFEEWAEKYEHLWLKKNKKSELDEVIRVLDSMNKNQCSNKL